jgi:hypothetical protein
MSPPESAPMATKKKASKPPPELSEVQADLLWHMQHGYQLENNPLEGGLLLRRLEDKEVVRPASANLNTVKALEERGLISPAKSHNPLTTIWRVGKKSEK